MSLNLRRLTSQSERSMEILDPDGDFLQRMNKWFIFSCLLALFVDPLFFYIPVLDTREFRLSLDKKLTITVCVLRSVCDLFYIYHIILQFCTRFVAPSSEFFGRGELVDDWKLIARKYMISGYFPIDVLAVLPIPQTVFTLVLPNETISSAVKDVSKYFMYCQYIPRLWRMLPLHNQVSRTSGNLRPLKRVGTSNYLLLYMLASHTIGAMWYIFSVERMNTCWRNHGQHVVTSFCSLQEPSEIDTSFKFGIFLGALKSGVTEHKRFTSKLLFCFWWGLRNMSALGQDLDTSDYELEILFTIFIFANGLVLFALLIANIQMHWQSKTVREDEMRVKQDDIEQWMHRRALPQCLRNRIRRYDQYKWQETRGVEEDSLIRSLPEDLRRDVKRYLCWSLLNRVPILSTMDDNEQLLDALCSFLRPVFYMENSIIIREGSPVNDIFFITRGDILTMTTNGGQTDIFTTTCLRSGDFFGEELLTWALDPNPELSTLPISTRTVQAKKHVEGFSLVAQDLKSVVSQFMSLFTKHLVSHTYRYYSQQWRAWGTRFIQASWRRYRRRKMERLLQDSEGRRLQNEFEQEGRASPSLRSIVYASRFATNMIGTVRRNEKKTSKTYSETEMAPLLLVPATKAYRS